MRAIITTLFGFIFLIMGFSNINAQSETVVNVGNENAVNSLIKGETPKGASLITAIQVKELQQKDPMLAILDIRDRESFELARINQSKYIGAEFTQEKIWMLNRNSNIVIYGDDVEKNEAMCKLITEKGFVNVYYLNGTLGDLSIQGMDVTGDIEKSDKLALKKNKKN